MLIGTGIQTIVIPLYILNITGSEFYMGLFTMLSMVPSVIASPVSGVLGDRFNRRNMMIISDFIRGIILVVLSLLAHY